MQKQGVIRQPAGSRRCRARLRGGGTACCRRMRWLLSCCCRGWMHQATEQLLLICGAPCAAQQSERCSAAGCTPPSPRPAAAVGRAAPRAQRRCRAWLSVPGTPAAAAGRAQAGVEAATLGPTVPARLVLQPRLHTLRLAALLNLELGVDLLVRHSCCREVNPKNKAARGAGGRRCRLSEVCLALSQTQRPNSTPSECLAGASQDGSLPPPFLTGPR